MTVSHSYLLATYSRCTIRIYNSTEINFSNSPFKSQAHRQNRIENFVGRLAPACLIMYLRLAKNVQIVYVDPKFEHIYFHMQYSDFLYVHAHHRCDLLRPIARLSNDRESVMLSAFLWSNSQRKSTKCAWTYRIDSKNTADSKNVQIITYR